MTEYIAKDGERLDEIAYRHYKTLVPMNIVLEANPSLLVPVLKAGDTVMLPNWEAPKANTEMQTLWA